MSNHSLPKVSVQHSVATEVDPGAGRAVFITAIINGTDAVIAAGVALSSSDNIILGKNTNISFDPPLQCATAETATPAAGVTIAYFIGRGTRTAGN